MDTDTGDENTKEHRYVDYEERKNEQDIRSAREKSWDNRLLTGRQSNDKILNGPL